MATEDTQAAQTDVATATPPVAAPTAAVEPVAPETVPAADPVVAAVAPVAKVVVAKPAADADAEVAETPVSALDPNDTDDELVASLKIRLAAWVKLVSKVAKVDASQKDFASAANLINQITKFVIQYPKVPVLDTLLAFFQQNATGVCDNRTYMLGSTTLNSVDEQKVGFLYNLFIDLARKSTVRVNSAEAVKILKKPEIVDYYNRKVSGIQAAAAQAALAQ